MKKLHLLFLTLFILTGCSDPHKYNEIADKQCLEKIEFSYNLNALLLEALKNDVKPSTIKKIIKKGASPSVTIGKNRTPIICYAKSYRAIETIYRAIDGHESPSFKLLDAHARTPLFYFQSPNLCEDYIKVVESNTKDEAQKIALKKEQTEEKLNIIRNKLLSHRDKYNRTPIFYATDKNMVNYWISNGMDLNHADKFGANVLINAIQENETCNKEFLEFLIENGANVNFSYKDGISPLGKAFECNRTREIIDFLVSKGVNFQNTNSTANLYFYVKTSEHIDLLKSKGMSANIDSKNGFYVNLKTENTFHFEKEKVITKCPLALTIAKDLGNDVIESMLKAGARPEKSYFIYNGKKISALKHALFPSENKALVDLLLKYGAEKSFDIDDILNITVKKDEISVLSKILNSGLKIENIKNQDSIFKKLLDNNMLDIAKKFISSGYDINKRTANGKLLFEYLLDDGYIQNQKISATEKLNFLIEMGLDVCKEDSSRNILFDKLLSRYSNININDLPTKNFEKIVKQTFHSKDVTSSIDAFKSLIRIQGIKGEYIDIFLKNAPKINETAKQNILIHILKKNFIHSISDNVTLAIIKNINNFDRCFNGKTMIGYALECENISLDIVKAISEKMLNPNLNTSSNFSDEKISPDVIARKINREEISDYLNKVKITKKRIGNKYVLKIHGFYIGMPRTDCIKLINLIEKFNYTWQEFYYTGLEFDSTDRLSNIIFNTRNINMQDLRIKLQEIGIRGGLFPDKYYGDIPLELLVSPSN